MDVYEKLGSRIQKLRRQENWSQEDLAFKAELHRTYISHLEGGKRQISLETVSKIAKGFGISMSELLKNL
jgi:transcriptional regulator with XRE-family HTH domain